MPLSDDESWLTVSLSRPRHANSNQLSMFYNGEFKKLILEGYRVASVQELKDMIKYTFQKVTKYEEPGTADGDDGTDL